MLFVCEYSSPGRVGTELGTKFFFTSFSACPDPAWLEIKWEWCFLIFWIFLLFFWNSLPRVVMEIKALLEGSRSSTNWASYESTSKEVQGCTQRTHPRVMGSSKFVEAHWAWSTWATKNCHLKIGWKRMRKIEIKIFVPFRSYPTRNTKFQKNSQKNSKYKKNANIATFLAKIG